ncbi:hypothetical protein AA15669_0509 [Saccharibacter floricola DSM 15669]|uniref:Uncharacterized protein n=1 Tax=Saccharibacter floricola DSM 15669 TaxID=1123227 RepID=A0ABQ0NXE1_9PROT|nr:hypothetical protein AA15669_0509 [Saccharibacter floricola DSM 15669]
MVHQFFCLLVICRIAKAAIRDPDNMGHKAPRNADKQKKWREKLGNLKKKA